MPFSTSNLYSVVIGRTENGLGRVYGANIVYATAATWSR